MSTATEMLAKYIAAEAALLDGKHVRLGERQLTMEDLDQIRAGRKEWERRVAAEQGNAAGAQTIGGLSFGVANFNK